MLDNFQLIPGEAFTAAGSLLEKTIDKVSNAIGWVAIPKANKKYRLEAENYLIEQIMSDEKMPMLAKAAGISNARRLIKEYENQYNILSIALDSLNETAEPEKLDDNWLAYFFDKARHVSKEDIALIWGQILAEEINNPNSVSRSLIHILSIIDYKDAATFLKIANFTVKIEEEYYPIILFDKFDIYLECGLGYEEIKDLADTGLVQSSAMVHSVVFNEKKKIIYFDFEMELDETKELYTGNVQLTKHGRELISIITNKKKMDGFDDFLRNAIREGVFGFTDTNASNDMSEE